MTRPNHDGCTPSTPDRPRDTRRDRVSPGYPVGMGLRCYLGHGASGTREFFASLIRYPGFAGTVNDIVIECGNGRYQELADRYFAGQAVARDELRQIWDNTTMVSGIWQVPMYEEILADIRAFNM